MNARLGGGSEGAPSGPGRGEKIHGSESLTGPQTQAGRNLEMARLPYFARE